MIRIHPRSLTQWAATTARGLAWWAAERVDAVVCRWSNEADWSRDEDVAATGDAWTCPDCHQTVDPWITERARVPEWELELLHLPDCGDEGDWACTCGQWHPPTLTRCTSGGRQITASGEVD